MTDNYIAGVDAGVSYAFEAIGEYNKLATNHAESDENYVAFGRNVDISISRNQNKDRVFEVGNRNAIATVTKQFSGTAAVNGTMSNAYWLLGVLGRNVDGGVVGAYTHTYTEANSQPTLTIKRVMSFGDTKGTETLVGGVINTCSITSAVGEAVKFSLDILYRYEANPNETATPEYVMDTEEIFTFAGATIEAPNGTELVGIENFEISFNNNVSLEMGLGSRYPEAVVSKNREYDISYTSRVKNYTELKKFLSTNQIATLRMNFENGAGDTLSLNFAEFHMNEDTLPTNPTDLVKEDCSGWAHRITSAVYTNTVQRAPAQAN